MFGNSGFRSQPGRMLKDAFRAGVVDELLPADEAFLHRDSAPGAQAIGKVCQGGVQGRGHGRHCHRGPQILSTEQGSEATGENILAADRASIGIHGI